MAEWKHPDRAMMRERITRQVKTSFQLDDVSGLEVFAILNRVATLSEVLGSRLSEGVDLSSPRWTIMLLLFLEEQMGKTDGLTPTVLSHSQRVSKNTISALLRGLEDQGYIQRELDPKDLRIFRIRLTPAGREMILNTAPRRIEKLNQILSVFSPAEVEQLISLLEKLGQTLHEKLSTLEKDASPHL